MVLFMARQQLYAKLTEIFRGVFDDDTIEISDSTTAGDIDGWDSLTHISLISEIEDSLGGKFSMKAVLDMKNVGEMVDIIETW
jgi:acyl carrier protein